MSQCKITFSVLERPDLRKRIPYRILEYEIFLPKERGFEFNFPIELFFGSQNYKTLFFQFLILSREIPNRHQPHADQGKRKKGTKASECCTFMPFRCLRLNYHYDRQLPSLCRYKVPTVKFIPSKNRNRDYEQPMLLPQFKHL